MKKFANLINLIKKDNITCLLELIRTNYIKCAGLKCDKFSKNKIKIIPINMTKAFIKCI